MKQVFIRQGEALVEDVPAPVSDPNRILVELSYSLISSGTESAGVLQSRQSLLARALKQPQNVEKAFNRLREEGMARTWQAVQGKLAAGMPTGYSCSGCVVDVGNKLPDFRVGMPVACAGAGKANHAEIVSVPANLAVQIPESCDLRDAASVSLGAIALQGLRRAAPTLGETFVVLGLGLVGQLTTQLLRATGVRVLGLDPIKDRVNRARELGMAWGHVTSEEAMEELMRLSGGAGADATLITAASNSSELVNQAMRMTRKKGRVIVVGDVGLALDRSPFYEKEIDFLISCSYGPGRYDDAYEEDGLDYPLPYVRWTEKRNMQEYLRLLAEQRIGFSKLIDGEFDVSEASSAYQFLQRQEARPLAVLLHYPGSVDQPKSAKRAATISVDPRKAEAHKIRIAVVGTGGFAVGTHLPNLRSLSSDFDLRAVVSRSGHNARDSARHFGAAVATTDYRSVLQDKDVNAVLIATRHNLHASMTLEALQAGKHVLVEKPLALTWQEVEVIQEFFQGTSSSPLLMPGFNRRFSPLARQMKEWVKERRDPMIINYRMNAGYIQLDHWVHSEEGGGRNIGEDCHIYDLFTYLTDSRAVSVQVDAIVPRTKRYTDRDNFIVTLKFEDGSLCTLTYAALGSKSYPKEQAEIFVDGQVIALDDFKCLSLSGRKSCTRQLKRADKGHQEELKVFARAIREAGEWPIPLWQQLQATEIALKVEDQLVLPNTQEKVK